MFDDAAETTVWEGNPSLAGALTVLDIVLIVITSGLWLVVPFFKWLGLRRTYYRVTAEEIHVRNGLVSTQENELKLYRVRDLSTYQSMIQRMFRVQDLVIRSSDVSHAELTLKSVPASLKASLRPLIKDARAGQEIRINE